MPITRSQVADTLRQLADRIGPTRGSGLPDVLREVTRRIGDDWKTTPYYDEVEQWMDPLWKGAIWPMISDCDFSVVVDLAAGHGRNSAKLAEHAGRIHVADINQENIDHCRRRFAGDPRFSFLVCDGLTLTGIPSGSVSLVYCFDAMVHFDSDTVRAYLAEFRRVLRPGGRGFCHHSNHTANPTGDFRQSPHWRNFMSKELFAHYAHKEGLTVLDQKVVDWGADAAKAIDCLSLFARER